MTLLVPTAAAEEILKFNQHIRPILSDKCFQCHGPDSAKRGADLRLDVRDDALKALAIVPGDPKRSAMIQRIHETDPDDVMPPPDSPRQLTDADRKTLTRWIEQGAQYEKHWSFSPLPASVPLPISNSSPSSSNGNEIDRFITTRLEQEKISPAPAASPERWLRRAAFDLTGLPPSQAELDTLLANPSPEARAQAVDRLLASPHFGEKMAVGWLDIARYADSFGYQSDLDTHAWPYRDWVIRALNQNLPWDQFITWQIAGDLLPNPTRDQITATAFNRVHRKTQEGGSVEAEYRQEGIADRVHTFGSAFLALTFECSRCHDHKYDPITMGDYYSLGAFFNSIDEWGLLHGNSSIQPNPSLFLTTPDQEKAIATHTTAIGELEKSITQKSQDRQPAFDAWLANPPPANFSDLTGSYDLETAEKDTFTNTADPKRPAKSSPNNTPVPGPRGQALSFTGDDPLTLGQQPGIKNCEDPVSMAFWLKPGEPTPRRLVFHNSAGYDPGYNGIELLIENGKLRWMIAREWPGNCIAIQSNDIITPSDWTHVTVTYDGSSRAAGLKIFLNGNQAPTTIIRDQLTKNSASGSGFTFGERVRDSGLRGGAVDEIHLFNRAVSRLEVKALHQNQPLHEVIAATPRDSNGKLDLQEYFFTAIDPELRAQHAELHKLRTALRKTMDGVRELPVMKEMDEPRPTRILARGEYSHPEGDPLPRVAPSALPPLAPDQPTNRLGLARWLTTTDHPLTARVQVNRIWQHFFGRGIVGTSDNFGSQGDLPSHPELLDWLARDFINHGWDMKRLCRQIVLSATYSQDSKTPTALRQKDPENILLARGPTKRLSGEELRDNALALSGLLHPTIGGPPTKPYLPDSATWRVLNSFLPEYKRDAAPGIYRRSLYSFWRRTAPAPGMLAFDVPSRDVCSVRRQQTNTPLQPLVMLNDPQFVEASRGLAIRMLRDGGPDLTSQTRWLFRESLGRHPDAEELQLLAEIHSTQLDVFQQTPEKATAFLKVGDLPPPADLPPIHLAAATVLANAVLNLDEAITLR
jgi:hypothetical protein